MRRFVLARHHLAPALLQFYRTTQCLSFVTLAGLAGGAFAQQQPATSPKTDLSTIRVIGATTVVTEISTGVPLPARVDTGATSCSIHCEAIEIEDAHPDPKQNIGKPVRFLVKHGNSEGKWVESKIVDHVKVRTAEREDERYKVKLQLRWEDMEKKVLATLNDRQKMKYPVLLGRNFLRDDFLVNVSVDDDD